MWMHDAPLNNKGGFFAFRGEVLGKTTAKFHGQHSSLQSKRKAWGRVSATHTFTDKAPWSTVVCTHNSMVQWSIPTNNDWRKYPRANGYYVPLIAASKPRLLQPILEMLSLYWLARHVLPWPHYSSLPVRWSSSLWKTKNLVTWRFEVLSWDPTTKEPHCRLKHCL